MNLRKWIVICLNMEISLKLVGVVIEFDWLIVVVVNCMCDGYLILFYFLLCGVCYLGNVRFN